MLPKKKRWMMTAEHNSSISLNSSQTLVTDMINSSSQHVENPLLPVQMGRTALDVKPKLISTHINLPSDLIQSNLCTKVFQPEYVNKLALHKTNYPAAILSAPGVVLYQTNSRSSTTAPNTNNARYSTTLGHPHPQHQQYITSNSNSNFYQPASSSNSTASIFRTNEPRRLSGSLDPLHRNPKMLNNFSPHLDFSTISAVARAASMLSSSQLEAAAALLSHWDSSTQFFTNQFTTTPSANSSTHTNNNMKQTLGIVNSGVGVCPISALNHNNIGENLK